MKLAGRQFLDFDPGHRNQNGQYRHDQKNQSEAEPQFIEHEHAVERRARIQPRIPKPDRIDTSGNQRR